MISESLRGANRAAGQRPTGLARFLEVRPAAIGCFSADTHVAGVVRMADSERVSETTPYRARRGGHEIEFRPLLVLAQHVAAGDAGEAALCRQRELVQRYEFARAVDAAE